MEQLFSFIIKAYYFDFTQHEASPTSSVQQKKKQRRKRWRSGRGLWEKKWPEPPGQNQNRSSENRPPQLAAKTLMGQKLKWNQPNFIHGFNSSTSRSCHANLLADCCRRCYDKAGKRFLAVCSNEESQSDISIPIQKGEQLPDTHRDVKELLRVIQHTDPDGDVPTRGHGWRPVRGVQCADAKSLRRSETLPCSKGNWLWVRFCHDEQRRCRDAERGKSGRL